MARISQYKALGTKMGGYKATLSKVQSMEYAKKHADWKAGEEKSLYGEIGGSVANILGIIDESKKLKAMEPLDKPGRPEVKLEQQEAEMIGDVGMDEEAGLGRFQDFDTSAPIPGLESSYMQGMKGEVELPNIPSPPERIDFTGARTAARGATESMRLSPDTTEGALPMGGAFFEEAGGRRGIEVQPEEGYPMWNRDSVGAGDATYPTAEEVAMYQPADRGREFAGAFSNLDALKDMNPLPLEKPVYPTAEEVEKYQPAPITDDMAFDTLRDTTLGDFDASSLPSKLSFASPSEQKLADILKERSGGQYDITPQMFDKLAEDFGYAETQNKNVRQRQIGEVGDKGTGAAEGIYQYETSKPYFSKKEQKMTKGSGSFQTGLQRVKNLYSEMGKDVPSWVSDVMDKDSPKYDSPLELTPEQQRELLMADLYYKKGSWKTLGEAFSKGDFKDAWLDLHWAGAKRGTKEYEEKGAYWDSVMTARSKR